MPIGVSSAPYAKFTKPGERHGGKIVDFRVVQTSDFDSHRPQYLEELIDGGWAKTFAPFRSDGRPNDPICQWELTVDTGVEDADGDTEKRIFIDPRKGKKNTTLEGKRGGDAVAIALKKAKAHRVGLEIGGTFFLISGEKVKDGTGPMTNTWTAEYEPPEGGPGTGTSVDEQPWLVGGARYDKAAELTKWEKRTELPALAASVASAQDKAAQTTDNPWPVSAGGQGVLDRLKRAHETSPRVNPRAAAVDDSEPPF